VLKFLLNLLTKFIISVRLAWIKIVKMSYWTKTIRYRLRVCRYKQAITKIEMKVFRDTIEYIL